MEYYRMLDTSSPAKNYGYDLYAITVENRSRNVNTVWLSPKK